MLARHNEGGVMRLTREIGETGYAGADDVNALLAKALQHVVEGSQLAGYARRRAGGGDTVLRGMCERFAEAGEVLDGLLRRRLAANL